MQIIPTLLTPDKKIAESRLRLYQNIFDWIQLDIMDGKFVDNSTLLPGDFVAFSELSAFKPDIHLMTVNPIAFLPSCRKIKAARVIGQIEQMPSQQEFVRKTLASACEAGLSLDLDTPVTDIDRSVFIDIDVLLVMSVKTGWGGQKFHHQVLEKVSALKTIRKQKGFKFRIALDGGVNLDTIGLIAKAGVDIVYVGSAVQHDPKKALQQLKRKCPK